MRNTYFIRPCVASFVEQFLSYGTSKTKNIYYKDTKEKDQMISFVARGLSLNDTVLTYFV